MTNGGTPYATDESLDALVEEEIGQTGFGNTLAMVGALALIGFCLYKVVSYWR